MDELIRERMRELGVSVRGLHEALAASGVEVTRQAVDAWIKGRSRPRLEHVSPLCDALRMSAWERARLLDLAAGGGS